MAECNCGKHYDVLRAREDLIRVSSLVLLIAVLVLIPLTLLYKVAAADGNADFCYVSSYYTGSSTTYRVYSHRPWREDLVIGYGKDSNEALDIANKFNCKIGVEGK